MVKYQDPASADKAYAIHKDLDETKEVMYKTIDQASLAHYITLK